MRPHRALAAERAAFPHWLPGTVCVSTQIKQFVTMRVRGCGEPASETELGLNRHGQSCHHRDHPPAAAICVSQGVPMTPQYNTTVGLFRNTPVELTAEPAARATRS